MSLYYIVAWTSVGWGFRGPPNKNINEFWDKIFALEVEDNKIVGKYNDSLIDAIFLNIIIGDVYIDLSIKNRLALLLELWLINQ